MHCAGIVLYNPDLERLQKNIDSIIDQVDRLFCVDNFSENIEKIQQLLKDYEKIELIKNPENLGIANALNQIMQKAEINGYEWVYTLDQDSISPVDVIKNLSAYISTKNGIICTNFLNQNDGKLAFKNNKESEAVLECITSGSLTSVYAWKTVGGFDNWLFIDCVDYDFCYKLRLKNFSVIRVNNIILMHDVGSLKIRRFMFLKVKTYNHSSFRNYYIVRNHIFMIRKYKKILNVPKKIILILKWQIIKILFEKNRIQTLKSMLKGIKDGKKKAVTIL